MKDKKKLCIAALTVLCLTMSACGAAANTAGETGTDAAAEQTAEIVAEQLQSLWPDPQALSIAAQGDDAAAAEAFVLAYAAQLSEALAGTAWELTDVQYEDLTLEQSGDGYCTFYVNWLWTAADIDAWDAQLSGSMYVEDEAQGLISCFQSYGLKQDADGLWQIYDSGTGQIQAPETEQAG